MLNNYQRNGCMNMNQRNCGNFMARNMSDCSEHRSCHEMSREKADCDRTARSDGDCPQTKADCGCSQARTDNCGGNYRERYQEILYSGELPIGMGYVPWQRCMENMEDEVYDLNKGFNVGTIFPCLDKPFMGRGLC